MQRITLPNTSYLVSRLCLGGNRLGGDLDQTASFALLDAFVAIGGNFIDTAHGYADWIVGNERSSSEKTIGRWLKSRKPEGLVIATKGGHPIDGKKRLDAASLRRDVTEACANLGVATLDIFYVHRDDPSRPVMEIIASLETLRREGLIRHYAASNWSTDRLVEAEAVARTLGVTGFIASQCEWSLARRNPGSNAADLISMDGAMLAFHRQHGMAAIPYSSQAKGYFDKVAAGTAGVLAAAYDNEDNRAMAQRLTGLAAKYAASPTEVMLAAMLKAPFPVVPVIGPRNAAQLNSSVACLALEIDAGDATALLQARGVE